MREEHIRQILSENSSEYSDVTRADDAGQDTSAVVNPKTIEIFTGFAATLKRIHIRLVMEGYTIKDGKIYKPGEYKEHEEPTQNNSRNR